MFGFQRTMRIFKLVMYALIIFGNMECSAAEQDTAVTPSVPAVAPAIGVVPVAGVVAEPVAGNRGLGVGDARDLSVELRGFTLNNQDGYCAPKDSRMFVDTLSDNGKILVHFTKVPDSEEIEKFQLGCEDIAENKIVKPYRQYSIETIKVQVAPAVGFGLETGVMIAPYKFHLHDKSLSGAASAAGYLGFRFGVQGVSNTVLVAAGLGVVPVTTQQNGTTTTNNAASFTAAFGDIINVTRTGLFQVGILFGFDWTGNSQYKHEAKPWIALSFGSNLTQ